MKTLSLTVTFVHVPSLINWSLTKARERYCAILAITLNMGIHLNCIVSLKYRTSPSKNLWNNCFFMHKAYLHFIKEIYLQNMIPMKCDIHTHIYIYIYIYDTSDIQFSFIQKLALEIWFNAHRNGLTHLPLVPHIHDREFGQHWFR